MFSPRSLLSRILCAVLLVLLTTGGALRAQRTASIRRTRARAQASWPRSCQRRISSRCAWDFLNPSALINTSATEP